jgi:hypothetical protein
MTRVPLMQAFPWQILGLMLIRSRQSILVLPGKLWSAILDEHGFAALLSQLDIVEHYGI